MVKTTDVKVFEYPEEANYGQWAFDHPECDSIIEQIGTGPTILVYAYATTKEGNKELENVRDEMFSDKAILMGVSMDAIRGFI